ncbi:hypothetical protein HY990_00825 [Candidatus Micrarchaeota archaeon]|nr:hypothetical protein [Candidatus Micrarchaeota archaeon]
MKKLRLTLGSGIIAATISCAPLPDQPMQNQPVPIPLDHFRDPRFPRLSCQTEPVRGILIENDPASVLRSDLINIIVRGNDDIEIHGIGPTTTDLSLNYGQGWHGVGEGGGVQYAPFIDMGNSTPFTILFRYRVDAMHVAMQIEQVCETSCTDTRTTGAFATATQPLVVWDLNQTNSYQVELGQYNRDINYCRGWCIYGEGRINHGPELELIVRNTDDPTDRWDMHFYLSGLDSQYARRQCRRFLQNQVCVQMQGYETQLMQAQLLVSVEGNCTRTDSTE